LPPAVTASYALTAHFKLRLRLQGVYNCCLLLPNHFPNRSQPVSQVFAALPLAPLSLKRRPAPPQKKPIPPMVDIPPG
jgi:hypothetical protein